MKSVSTVSVQETARRLGCTLKWVYDLLYAGKLPGQKVGRSWRIPESAVLKRLKQGASGATPGR